MTYNPLVHNRQSYRLKNYDYSSEGLYFVTICCENQEHLFGKVVDSKVILTELGLIAYAEWLHTSTIRLNVQLHEFVVMPNHMHAIIEIVCKKGDNKVGEFKSPSQTIGSIIRGFKIAVIKRYRDLNGFTGEIKIWQPRFYDVIIRDDKSYNRICNYIIDNPKRWNEKQNGKYLLGRIAIRPYMAKWPVMLSHYIFLLYCPPTSNNAVVI